MSERRCGMTLALRAGQKVAFDVPGHGLMDVKVMKVTGSVAKVRFLASPEIRVQRNENDKVDIESEGT